jgi:hypothetical protein
MTKFHFRVLVCGGRDYADRDRLFATLDRIHAERAITLVIHGGARGADRLSGEWATARLCECISYPAQWEIYGPRAGPMRNQQMLDEGRPDLVVVFPGGRGTANMLRKAQLAGVEVVIVGIGETTVSS